MIEIFIIKKIRKKQSVIENLLEIVRDLIRPRFLIDSDRLRELNAAISTANTSKSGQPLSGGRWFYVGVLG